MCYQLPPNIFSGTRGKKTNTKSYLCQRQEKRYVSVQCSDTDTLRGISTIDSLHLHQVGQVTPTPSKPSKRLRKKRRYLPKSTTMCSRTLPCRVRPPSRRETCHPRHLPLRTKVGLDLPAPESPSSARQPALPHLESLSHSVTGTCQSPQVLNTLI